MTNGFNPMRWDCTKNGCFNKVCRPKIEVFAECFPRRINFGDVDGEVEIKGFFCQLEWKSLGGAIPAGQAIKYKQLTRNAGNIVFVVWGNAETMDVERFCWFWCGENGGVKIAPLESLKHYIKTWADCADAQFLPWSLAMRTAA